MEYLNRCSEQLIGAPVFCYALTILAILVIKHAKIAGVA